jgi:hypothetical protein
VEFDSGLGRVPFPQPAGAVDYRDIDLRAWFKDVLTGCLDAMACRRCG